MDLPDVQLEEPSRRFSLITAWVSPVVNSPLIIFPLLSSITPTKKQKYCYNTNEETKIRFHSRYPERKFHVQVPSWFLLAWNCHFSIPVFWFSNPLSPSVFYGIGKRGVGVDLLRVLNSTQTVQLSTSLS